MAVIAINEKNREKIEAAIKEEEGRAKVRTLEYGDILDAIKTIESRLPIPKKALHGTHVDVDVNAQAFPSAYKYTPESTHFQIENHHGKWYFIRVDRYVCRRPKDEYIVTLSESAKEALLEGAQNLFN